MHKSAFCFKVELTNVSVNEYRGKGATKVTTSCTFLTGLQGFVFTTLSQRSDTKWICETSN